MPSLSMSLRKTLLISAVAWLLAITLLHGRLNLNWFAPADAASGVGLDFGRA